MERSSVMAAVATGVAGVAAAAVYFGVYKRQRVDDIAPTPAPPSASEEAIEAEMIDEPAPPSFSLLAELLDDDALMDVVRHTPALAAARLARVSTLARSRLLDPSLAQWCAASRKRLLLRRAVAGDLPLAFEKAVEKRVAQRVAPEEPDSPLSPQEAPPPQCVWTLERLHLCEHPPRFPPIYFRFASDAIEDGCGPDGSGPASQLAIVADLLRRHPKLRLRIHGYAQPNAPGPIGEALAQARATSVRQALLELLADVPEFADEVSARGCLDRVCPACMPGAHASHACLVRVPRLLRIRTRASALIVSSRHGVPSGSSAAHGSSGARWRPWADGGMRRATGTLLLPRRARRRARRWARWRRTLRTTPSVSSSILRV